MIVVTNPADMPRAYYLNYCIESLKERKIIPTPRPKVYYVFRSKIINALYVYIPTGEK